MKRDFTLIGLLLPFLEASPPLKGQHHVRPTQRKVEYGKNHIPSESSILNAQTESKNQINPNNFVANDYFGHGDDSWYIHIDALYEHPDKTIKQILRRNSNATDGITKKCLKNPIEQLTTFQWRWLRNFFTLESTYTFKESHNRVMLESYNQTNITQLTSFNVSANTEYNVSFGTSSESGSGNATQIDDISTVIITSNDPNKLNSTSNSYGLNDDDAEVKDKRVRHRPLRIRSFLSHEEGGGKHITSDQRIILLQEIIKPALLSWSAALRVDPVIGNLTVDPKQLSHGGLCGPGGDLPSIVVPADHISFGVPNTDFILYLHLAFVLNDSDNTTSSGLTSSENSTSINYNSTAPPTTLSQMNATNISASNSSSSGKLTSKKQCSGDYLAASSFCSTDQYDRPIAAIIHICIGPEFFDRANLRTNIMVISHELGHVLGFNAVSLAHFRRPDGTPYTDRDHITGEIPIVEINCTGPVGSNRTGRVALPSDEILKFRTVRGGVRVAEIVTPSVRQVARNHFDCQELPGAELESGEFLPLSSNPSEISCIGDHWERRLFKTDLMNPLIDENVEFSTRFSTITLAYFADSGWYQVDLSRASLSAGWGRAAGCDFVEQTCVNANDGQVPSSFNSFFCNDIPVEAAGYTSDIHGCTTDLTRKASCSIGHYEVEIPPAYQYFSFKYGSNVGGADPFMDYCPIYAGFVNGLCSDSSNEALIKVNYIERFGQKNSRCLSGEMTRASSSLNEDEQNSTIGSLATALCLPIACVVEDRTLRIQVNGDWKVCSFKDEILFTSDSSSHPGLHYVEKVICPDPIRVCPTFYCHRDCLGSSRLCDYDIGRCICSGTASGNSSNTDNADWYGKNFANVNESEDFSCNTSNSNESIDLRNTESFYLPEDNDDTAGLPTSDSPLSDYYYKTERNLKTESSLGFWNPTWKGLVSVSGSLIFIVLMSFLSYYSYGRCFKTIERNEAADVDAVDDTLSTNDTTRNPNKDKLMASIVVNLRMNDTNLQRLRREDPLSTRDSETDLSMTDTDGVSDVVDHPEFSIELPSTELVYGGTIVDLTSHDNDVLANERYCGGLNGEFANDYVDPLALPSNPSPQQAVVRRRRHFFSRMQ
jgi:hypothetical protein